MGNTLTRADIARYRDELELEKQAAISRIAPLLRRGLRWGARGVTSPAKGAITGMQTAAERAIHPIKGMRAGWASMTPSKELAKAVAKGPQAQAEWGKGFLGSRLGRAGEHFQRGSLTMKDIASGRGGPRAKAFFEELSRRGWTGRGAVGKYMPVGQKGMLAGFGGMAVPDVVRAAKRDPSQVSEGGGFETGLGELAGLGGFVAGGGLGLLPGLALWYGGERLGKGVGRIADRMRAGAGLREAATAPGPSEAAGQLARIQRYYG